MYTIICVNNKIKNRILNKKTERLKNPFLFTWTMNFKLISLFFFKY